MTLTLTATPRESETTTAGSLELDLSLHHDGAEALTLPGPGDTSGALSFEVRDHGGALVRRMSGITHQEMMVGGRPDTRPALAALGPGDTWRWTVDLASYHYPLPAGEFTLEARYEHPAAGVSLRSAPCALTVRDLPVRRVTAVRDNSLLDMLTLVTECERDGERVFYVRQHNHDRPLAAWYAQPVASRVEQVVFAAHAFMRFDTFDHCYDRVALWRSGDVLTAQRLRWGRPLGEATHARLRPRETLTAAGERDDGSLDVVLSDGEQVRYARLADGALTTRFEHPTAGLLAAQVAPGSLHLLAHVLGTLVLTRFSVTGELLDERPLYQTSYAPVSGEFDGCRRVARALFHGGPDSHEMEMVATGPGFDEVGARVTRVAAPGALTEAHFDRDDAGRFHLLATAGDRLYYVRDDDAARVIAEGQAAYRPQVVARRGVWLGAYREGEGYRFQRFSHRPNATGLVSFDARDHEA